MNNYTPSSELQRAAEEQERNKDRRIAWARRVFEQEGRWPRLTPNGLWRRIIDIRRKRAAGGTPSRHDNFTTVKMPRRRRQYMHAQLPEPPEVA